MNRRDFLTSATALTAGLAGGTAMPAFAQTAAARSQFPGITRRSLGDWTVMALSDGYLKLSSDVLIGIEPDEAQALLQRNFYDPQTMTGAVNAYLIDTGDTLVLVDTGTGPVFGATLGQLVENLGAAGYTAADVDLILCTHLHPDHVGGCLMEAGNPFVNAGFAVSAVDYNFFTDDAIRAGAPDQFKPFFDMAVAALDSFDDRVVTFNGMAEVGPGINAVPLPGHTPGHSGFMVQNGDEALFIVGDLIHVPGIQFDRPDVALAFDTDPATAAETRAKALDQMATDRVLTAGMHLSFPGFGYVDRAAQGYRFVPAPWDYS